MTYLVVKLEVTAVHAYLAMAERWMSFLLDLKLLFRFSLISLVRFRFRLNHDVIKNLCNKIRSNMNIFFN